MRRLIALLVTLLVVGAGVLYFAYGTIEPCGILREKMRREARNDGNALGGLLAAAMPDSFLNAIISAQHEGKPVTPALCVRLLLTEPTPNPQAAR
jgi:hypothetical protein